MIDFCGDCGCKEGEIHEENCDMEICQTCGGQYFICDCPRLENEEREPFFERVFCCKRCGLTMPELKMISNKEWKLICGSTYNEKDILCIECMNFIKDRRGGDNGIRKNY